MVDLNQYPFIPPTELTPEMIELLRIGKDFRSLYAMGLQGTIQHTEANEKMPELWWAFDEKLEKWIPYGIQIDIDKYQLTGTSGEQGPQGPEGPQGPQGVEGAQGPMGPQGDQGVQGEQGAQGIEGAQGPIGPQGEQGVQGEQGTQGATGEQGPMGPQGPSGEQGPQGPKGDQGNPFRIEKSYESVAAMEADTDVEVGTIAIILTEDTQSEDYGKVYVKSEEGWDFIVDMSVAGAQGIQGPVGPEGPQGPKGDQGEVGPMGPQGIQGEQGIQGAKGDQGEIGPIGPQGSTGEQGPQGVKGDQGEVGPQGAQGPAGEQGIPGVQGATGPQGPQGAKGDQGEMGPQGPQGVDGPMGPQGVPGQDYDPEAYTRLEGRVTELESQVAFLMDAYHKDHPTEVATAEELRAALESGDKYVKITEPMSFSSALDVSHDAEITLDADMTFSGAWGLVASNGAKIAIQGSGNITNTRSGGKTIRLIGGSEMTIDLDGKIKSDKNYAIYVEEASKLTIENAQVEAQECAISAWKDTEVTINGGVFTTVDNSVISGNGTAGMSGNHIIINGGEFNGGITSAGYIACGIYVPNNDIVEINGGEFNITGGCGVLARAGQVTIGSGVIINTTGDTVGKVGDSRVVVPCSAAVFDAEANYPALTDDAKITIEAGAQLSSEDSHGATYVLPVEQTAQRMIDERS